METGKSILGKLNGWWKTLIAFAPALLAWGLLAIFTSVNYMADFTLPLLIGLIVAGAILAGFFSAQAVRKRKPHMHPALIGLIFLAVGAAYVILNYATCCLVFLVSLMDPN